MRPCGFRCTLGHLQPTPTDTESQLQNVTVYVLTPAPLTPSPISLSTCWEHAPSHHRNPRQAKVLIAGFWLSAGKQLRGAAFHTGLWQEKSVLR